MKTKMIFLMLLTSFFTFCQNPSRFEQGISPKRIVPMPMTTSQIAALPTQVTGTMVYNSTLGFWQYYDGDSWELLGGVERDLNDITLLGNFTEQNIEFQAGAGLDFFDGTNRLNVMQNTLSANRNLGFPDASGTLIVNVNGNTANTSGVVNLEPNDIGALSINGGNADQDVNIGAHNFRTFEAILGGDLYAIGSSGLYNIDTNIIADWSNVDNIYRYGNGSITFNPLDSSIEFNSNQLVSYIVDTGFESRLQKTNGEFEVVLTSDINGDNFGQSLFVLSPETGNALNKSTNNILGDVQYGLSFSQAFDANILNSSNYEDGYTAELILKPYILNITGGGGYADDEGLFRVDLLGKEIVAGDTAGVISTTFFKLNVNDKQIHLTAPDKIFLNATNEVSVSTGSMKLNGLPVVTNRLTSLTTTEILALTPTEGEMYYNTTLNVIVFYDGTAWQKISHSAM